MAYIVASVLRPCQRLYRPYGLYNLWALLRLRSRERERLLRPGSVHLYLFVSLFVRQDA